MFKETIFMLREMETVKEKLTNCQQIVEDGNLFPKLFIHLAKGKEEEEMILIVQQNWDSFNGLLMLQYKISLLTEPRRAKDKWKGQN